MYCEHKHFNYVYQKGTHYEDSRIDLKCATCEYVKEGFSLNTGLPIVSINSNDENIAKDSYVSAKMQILNTDSSDSIYNLQIKGRGNATWEYPKKPYKIKLNKKSNLLGMDSNKNWVLLANYTDKTLLRTAIGLKTNELLNIPYTPNYRFVELIMNGEYIGNYMLVESIEKGENRINVSETGFIVEQTHYDDKDVKIVTDLHNFLFQFKYPEDDEITEGEYNYTSAKINSFLNLLWSSNEIAFS